MAFCVIVIDSPSQDIGELNSKLLKSSTNALEGVVALRNQLDAILAGSTDASVQFTSRDTDPSVATSGSGSAQVTYNLK